MAQNIAGHKWSTLPGITFVYAKHCCRLISLLSTSRRNWEDEDEAVKDSVIDWLAKNPFFNSIEEFFQFRNLRYLDLCFDAITLLNV